MNKESNKPASKSFINVNLFFKFFFSILTIIILTSTAYSLTPSELTALEQSTVAYYTFDNAQVSGSTLLDLTPNENDGTASNTRIFGGTGILNEGGDLTQGDDFLNTNSQTLVPSNSDFSISMWVYILQGNSESGNGLIGNNDGQSGRWNFVYRDSGELTMFGDTLSTRVYDSGTNINFNDWEHIVMTRESDTWKIYVNGVNTNTWTSTGSLSNNNDIYIGATGQGLASFTDGNIDEVLFLDRAFTQEEVTYLFNSGAPTVNQQYPYSSPGPTIQTDPATEVSFFSATLNGELTDLADEPDVNVFFQYREDGSGTWINTPTQSKSTTGTFSESLTGLEETQEYEYRAVVQWDNGNEEAFGTIQTFTTLTRTLPTIETLSATDIGGTSATLRASVTLNDYEEVDLKFFYNEDGQPLTLESSSLTITADGTYEIGITGLSSATTYDYQARLFEGSTQLATGSTLDFTTLNEGLEFTTIEVNNEPFLDDMNFTTPNLSIDTIVEAISTNTDVNQFYTLKYTSNNSIIVNNEQFATNSLTGNILIQLPQDEEYTLILRADNGVYEIEREFNFLIDTTPPTIINNIPNEVNEYTFNLSQFLNISDTSGISLASINFTTSNQLFNFRDNEFIYNDDTEYVNFDTDYLLFKNISVDMFLNNISIFFEQRSSNGRSTEVRLRIYTTEGVIEQLYPLGDVTSFIPREYVNNNLYQDVLYITFEGRRTSSDGDSARIRNIEIAGESDAFMIPRQITFNENGVINYEIFANDTLGNDITQSGSIFVNPLQRFSFEDPQGNPIENFTLDGEFYETVAEIPIYDIGLGEQSLLFEKTGFARTNITEEFTTTSQFDETYTIMIPVTILNIFDGLSSNLLEQRVDIQLIGPEFAGLFETSNGSITIDNITNLPGEYRLILNSSGYNELQYFFTHTGFDVVNLSLFMIDNQELEEVKYILLDGFGNRLGGCTIKITQYSIRTNSYKTITMEKSNTNGEAIFKLNLNNFYKPQVTCNGATQNFPGEKITSIPVILTFVQERLSLFQDLPNIVYEPVRFIQVNNETGRFNFNFADDNSIISKGCLVVEKRAFPKNEPIDETCINTASGSINIDFELMPGQTYIGRGFVTYEGVEYQIDSLTYRVPIVNFEFGVLGIFISMLIIGGLAIVGLIVAKGIGVLIGGTIGLWVAVLATFWSVASVTILSVWSILLIVGILFLRRS